MAISSFGLMRPMDWARQNKPRRKKEKMIITGLSINAFCIQNWNISNFKQYYSVELHGQFQRWTWHWGFTEVREKALWNLLKSMYNFQWFFSSLLPPVRASSWAKEVFSAEQFSEFQLQNVWFLCGLRATDWRGQFCGESSAERHRYVRKLCLRSLEA